MNKWMNKEKALRTLKYFKKLNAMTAYLCTHRYDLCSVLTFLKGLQYMAHNPQI